jgi:hypothetical protein
MKLLLRRDQRSSLLGKQIFSLDVRAQLSDEEKAHIKTYRLGDTLLYKKYDLDRLDKVASGLAGFFAGALAGMDQVEINARDLENGRRIECKNIVEMLGVEGLIKEAAANFRAVLEAAAKFGGEEVIEL